MGDVIFLMGVDPWWSEAHVSADTSNPRPKNVQTGQRKGPPLLVPPTPYPQLYFWSGRPCIAPTSMTSAISKRLLPSALICSGSMGFSMGWWDSIGSHGIFDGIYGISWDFSFHGIFMAFPWGFSMGIVTLIFTEKNHHGSCLPCFSTLGPNRQRNSQDQVHEISTILHLS